jgi:lipid II:glycine glycyltransferase (peptidoglycan interpeptide bridge formation enzyme)
VIDLGQPEDILWRNIGRITRKNIGTAQKEGVVVREGKEFADAAWELIRDTFRRSSIPFMSREAFKRCIVGLGDGGRLMMAEHHGVPQSYCLFGFSRCCAYAIYGGNVARQHQGAMKLLLWEAIRYFRGLGVKTFDFVGARINPQRGSKQEAINLMKKRFGATLIQGYIWKYPLRPWRAMVYSLGVRMLRGGDIVDQERHKLTGLGATVG